MTEMTLEIVLAQHGIAGEGMTQVDNARENGIYGACLGCGSVYALGEHSPSDRAAYVAHARAALRAAECCYEGDLEIL